MEILLISSVFLGIVAMLFSKKWWIGSLISIVSFVVYFFIFGTANWFFFIILCFGILLIILEILIPNFGMLGTIGTILSIVGLSGASNNPIVTLYYFGIAFILSVISAIVLIKIGYQLQIGRKWVLETNLTNQAGYKTFQKDYMKYLNQKGKTITPLRPVGKAKIGDTIVEVMTEGDMIEVDTMVSIVKIEGNKLIVRREV